MNSKQKKIIIAMIVIISAMLLYPPHVITRNGTVFNVGYGWITDPPKLRNAAAVVNVDMLLIQWLGVLFVGGLALFLTKQPADISFSSGIVSASAQESLKPEMPSPENTLDTKIQSEKELGPEGVGGWLLLLVVGMVLIGPVLGTREISSVFSEAEKSYPEITSIEQWQTYKKATWWVFSAFAAASFFGGCGLVYGKSRTVVNLAIAILWICGPVAMLVLCLFLPIMFLGNSIKDSYIPLGEFIASIMSAITWTIYLVKSKRVRNTYGSHGA